MQPYQRISGAEILSALQRCCPVHYAGRKLLERMWEKLHNLDKNQNDSGYEQRNIKREPTKSTNKLQPIRTYLPTTAHRITNQSCSYSSLASHLAGQSIRSWSTCIALFWICWQEQLPKRPLMSAAAYKMWADKLCQQQFPALSPY